MKKLMVLQIVLLLEIVLTACSRAQSTTSGNTGDFANWGAWKITWKTAQNFVDVTVKLGDAQKTYAPQQADYVFLAMQAEMINTSQETQEMRFWQGPIYLTDKDQNVYDLVGVAHQDMILMAPPYLLEDKTRFTTTKWNDGRFFTIAYQHEPKSWFIQATPNSLFHVDFLFTVPQGISGLVLHFGNGMTVGIE